MYEAKKLREERAELIGQLQDVAKQVKDEERSFTAEEKEQCDRLNEARKELDQRIETTERMEVIDGLTVDFAPENREAIKPQARVTERDKDLALRGWIGYAGKVPGHVPGECIDAAQRCGVNLASDTLTLRLSDQQPSLQDVESRAGLIVGTDASGGYTANDTVVKGLEKSLLYYGGMMQHADVFRTGHGNPIRFVTLNDTTNAPTAYKAELADGTTTDPAFGEIVMNAYTFNTNVFPVSLELLQDSELPISAIVSEALGERLGRAINTTCTAGDGTNKATGVSIGATVKGADAKDVDGTASATEWHYASLVDLLHSVDIAYRRSPKAGFMMNDDSAAICHKMVDGNNHPIWQPSVVAGQPDRILGYPVWINNDMPAPTTGKKPVLFGDFSKYKLRMVKDVTVLVARERLIEKLAVGFYAFARWDGKLVNTAAIKHLLMA